MINESKLKEIKRSLYDDDGCTRTNNPHFDQIFEEAFKAGMKHVNNGVLDDVSGSKKKRIRLLTAFDEFEEFVNSDVDIISLDIKAVEPSFRFQDGFNAVVYYR